MIVLTPPELVIIVAGAFAFGFAAFAALAYRRASNAALGLLDLLTEVSRERDRLHALVMERENNDES